MKLSEARSKKIMLAPSTLFPRFWQRLSFVNIKMACSVKP